MVRGVGKGRADNRRGARVCIEQEGIEQGREKRPPAVHWDSLTPPLLEPKKNPQCIWEDTPLTCAEALTG